MVVNARRAAHTADTRRALVSSARRLFARRGYAATTLEDVCRRAGVTKGALYHHFRDKEDLFVAVLDQVEFDFVEAGTAAVDDGATVWEALRAAGAGFLDVCARSDTRRIVIEAPAVLGWERCREVENSHAIALLRSALDHAARDSGLASDDPQVLAQLLAAVFNEAGMIVAAATDPNTAHEAVRRELALILRGLEATSNGGYE
jgi:AcrR family transcriptional regulator